MATNTTATATTHTGNGSTNNFAISFSFLANNEVDVTVAGVLKTLDTHYTISGSTVTFTSGNTPANGAAIKFQRDTNISAKKVDFQDGSVLTETDLDTNSDQVLFAQQEITDKLSGIEEGATGDQTAAEIRTLVESATDSNVFTDADHTKLNGIETAATADQTAAEIRTLVESASDSNVFTDADHTKLNGIEASATADQTAAEIRTLVESATDSNVFTDADHTKLNGIETGATADQTVSEIKSLIAGSPLDASHLAANSVDSSELVDGSIDTSHLSADCVNGTKIADNAIGSEHLQANSVGTSEIADAELTTLAGMQSGTASKLADSTALTADLADLNQLDGMAKQTTITDDDTKFPTSGAVVDYVAAQIAPIGGLEVIANEDSFPTTQPASGVVISISDIEGLIVNGSGVATNARTSGNGSDNVTINGFPSSLQSKTMAAGLGLMVSSTGSSQTYTYHKLLAKEADVEQLSNDINDFAARYRVGSSNPTTDLDAGDLFFNTSTSKLLVYNATNSAWEEAQSIGNFFISTFSESVDGSRQDFTVSNAPANAQQILLSINGVVQKPNSGTSTPSEGFALSGSTVKLAAAPPSGSDIFIVVMGSTVNIGTPSNNTVTTAILQNGSVTPAKVVSGQDFTFNSVSVGKGANSVAGNTVLGESALDASVSGGNNTAIGGSALTDLTSGTSNVAVGQEALKVNTTGASNTAVGRRALDANTTASNNTAVGNAALGANTTGPHNIAVGRNSLLLNTTGGYNVAVGGGALDSNVSGSNNVAVGFEALQENTSGNNTAIGYKALEENTSGTDNVAVGYEALDANTTANNNTAIGDIALTENTTGADNTSVGASSLAANTTGASNVAVGANALDANTTASNNTGIGFAALGANTTGTQNTAVGSLALDANTTGASLTAVGHNAGGSNTTANNTTAIGQNALLSNTTGGENTAVGSTSLDANSTGQANTAIGYAALGANTTANNNTACGYASLFNNTTGANNAALGLNSLLANTTASNNTGVGYNSLASNTTGASNTAVGKGALDANTTANGNTAVGDSSLTNNTTGGENTATGFAALGNNTTASNNTAFGYYALLSNTTGTQNVAIGQGALDACTTGSDNTALGRMALSDLTTSSDATAVGSSAGENAVGTKNTFLGYIAGKGASSGCNGESNVAIGHSAMYQMTSATNNTVVGRDAGSDLTTGSNNLFLGNGAGTSASPNGLHQTDSNRIVLGNNNITDAHIKVSFTATSDERDKTDITDFTKGLDIVNSLRPVTYKWDMRSDYSSDLSTTPDGSKKSDKTEIGLIAQEVETIEKANGYGTDENDRLFISLSSDGLHYGLKYERLVPVLINAIKELSAKVTALEAG